jgi:hypothetical protein
MHVHSSAFIESPNLTEFHYSTIKNKCLLASRFLCFLADVLLGLTVALLQDTLPMVALLHPFLRLSSNI